MMYIPLIYMPHHEDYEPFEERSCILKHWPAMWPEEIAAEQGLREERQRRKASTYVMAQDKTHRVLRRWRKCQIKCKDAHKAKIALALISLADESGWEEIDESEALEFGACLSHKAYKIL